MTERELKNTLQRLHNAGRERIAKIIENGTAGGRLNEEFYIYLWSCFPTLHEKSDIRCLLHIDGVQENVRGAYIPRDFIDDYLKAKEGNESGSDSDELEAFFDAIEEAFDNKEGNGFICEADFMEELDRAIEEEADNIASATGIDIKTCAEWLYSNYYLGSFDEIEYNEADFEKFVAGAQKRA